LVERLLRLLAAGETRKAVLADYPYLDPEDGDATSRWTTCLVENRTA
jgi:uncharacterized protein (DUF433 family)